MANNCRGRTLDFDPNRRFLSRSITIEHIFGIHCGGVQRTEKSLHSDGASSVDIHEDCFCSDLVNCSHIVVRTEHEKKETTFESCQHYPERIRKVIRHTKVWEGKRERTRDPYFSMEVPEEFPECNNCEFERLGLRNYPPIFSKGKKSSINSGIEEILKKFTRLDLKRPKGSRSLRDLHKWVTGLDDQRQPWLRADLLRSRKFSQLEERKIVKLHYESANCISQSNKHNESHVERTETATFYDGVKSMDIHSDHFCRGTMPDCYHLDVSVRKVTKTVNYNFCNKHKINVAARKQSQEEVEDCLSGFKTPVITKDPNFASCPRCRKAKKTINEHVEGRRRKRSRKVTQSRNTRKKLKTK